MATNTIYLLRNKINNKIYIGQTWLSLQKRMGPGGRNYNNSTYLWNAIQRYGHENFVYEILETCETQEDADRLEDQYIVSYNSKDLSIGYNLKSGGRGGLHSEETKFKMSETMKNKEWSDDALIGRNKITGYWQGKVRGPQTEEKKAQNSEFFIQWHQDNEHPMLDQHHTDEAKEKISNANKGRKRSPESVAKGAAARKHKSEKEIVADYQAGMVVSKIVEKYKTGNATIYRILERNNIAKVRPNTTWTGKTHTAETKDKMAAKRSEFWANKNKSDE